MSRITAIFARAIPFLLTVIALLNAAEVEAQEIKQQAGAMAFEQREANFLALRQKAQSEGPVPVIVQFDPSGVLRVPAMAGALSVPLAKLSKAQEDARVRTVSEAQTAMLASMKGRGVVNAVKRMKYSPHLAMTVDMKSLAALHDDPNVLAIHEDQLAGLSLAESIPFIHADQQWSSGYTGAGQTVAVLDTGVDKTHPFLAGKVVSEACYSTTNPDTGASSVCPGGANSTAPGSGVNCTVSSSCSHGTHVAGIAAGKDPGGVGFNGVAKDASIISIQVFSSLSTGISSYYSDLMLALERVYALRNTYDIASVNMSLGGGQYYSHCDGNPLKGTIDNLKAAGIATIIASGNEYYRDSMAAPACISSAVSVGATYDTQDTVSEYSNIASFISLLAPGSDINSSVPGGSYANFNGTSMATPHVAGAWAILKQKDPSATVDSILNDLRTTGVSVDDTRTSGTVTGMKRINLGVDLPPVSLGEALDNTALTWSSSGNATWRGQSLTSYFGGDSAQSGAVSDNQASHLETTVTGPAALTFYWKVSSEQGFDFLRLYLDGVLQVSVSGEADWQQRSVAIPSGQHTVRWSYEKDASASAGQDAGWVDKVAFLPGGTSYPLTVTKTGQGTVTSIPAGINCGADCSESYVNGTSVTLTAAPAAGYFFAGWSGACTGTASCVVAMTAARSVTATFSAVIPLGEALDNTTLTWTTSGNAGWGGQTVVSFYGGDAALSGDIDDSQASHLQTSVTGPGTLTFYWKVSSEQIYDLLIFSLDGTDQFSISGEVDWQQKTMAIPSGQHALRWSYYKDGSDTSGSDAGWVDKVVYTPQTATYPLTVTKTGEGAVTSNPAGINCGTDCNESYASGTTVTLTATPASGYTFTGWSGACAGVNSVCTVTMNSAKTVTADFVRLHRSSWKRALIQ